MNYRNEKLIRVKNNINNRFFRRIDSINIKILLTILVFLTFLIYISLIGRLLIYGIPFDLISLNDIVLFSQVSIFTISFAPLALVMLISYLGLIVFHSIKLLDLFINDMKNKSIKYAINREFFIFKIGIFITILITMKISYYLSLSILLFFVFLDILINYKERSKYLKLGILLTNVIIITILVLESFNHLNYYEINDDEKPIHDTPVKFIASQYILAKQEPYIASVKIEGKNKTETILILGKSDSYIYYYSREKMINMLNEKVTVETKNKICGDSKKLYPSYVIELLETSVFKKVKFERKKAENIAIQTVYKGFHSSFCEVMTVDE